MKARVHAHRQRGPSAVRQLAGLIALGLGLACAQAGTMVEFTEGTSLALDLSPDGTRLAMDLQGIVWILPTTGGAATPLTHPLWQARHPRWTRDGTALVFSALHPDARNLWLVPADGGPPRQLTEGPWSDRDPAVHPDGEHVVFVSDRSGSDDLWRLRISDGQLEQLSFHRSREAQPAISPDGQRIAYVSEDAEGHHLRLRGAGSAQATLLSSPHPLAAPSWRADGSLLMLVREREGRGEKMLVLVGDEATLKPATWGEQVAPQPAVWPAREFFLYSADGLIKRRRLGSRRAEVVPFFAVTSLPDTLQAPAPAIPDGPERSPVRGARAPRIAPDGEAVAVTALGRLWRVDRRGEAIALAGDERLLPLDPAWSPAGDRLAFVAETPGGSILQLVSREGGEPRTLARLAGQAQLPNFSPTGDLIALLVAPDPEGTATDVVVVDTRSGEATTLVTGLEAPGRPEWVHGQRLLLATSAEAQGPATGPAVITVVDLPLGRRSLLPGMPLPGLGPRGHDGPAASPDGRRLAFIRDGRLWVAELDATGESVQTARPVGDTPAASPSWTADNHRILFLHGSDLRLLDLRSGDVTPWPVTLDHRPYPGDPLWVLRARRLYDPAAGGYVADRDIFIEGQRIVAVVPRDQRAMPERVVEAGDLAVLPGLIDSHARSSAAAGADLGRNLLAHGVTTVREPATEPYTALERRESWASGQRLGPRLLHGGAVLDGVHARRSQTIALRSAEQVALEVERARLLGQHFILSGDGLPGEQLLELVHLATAAGIRVATTDVAATAFSGAAAVEGLDPGGRGATSQLTAGGTDLARLAARSGLALSPLLNQAGHTDESRQRARLASRHATLTTIAGGGGLITAGSGAITRPAGAGLHAEIALLAASPLGSAAALRAATLDAAWALGLAGSLGSVAEGKLADLILVEGDPLANPADLARIRAVISGGRYLPVDLLRSPAAVP
jgi:Tol biopolymer transport system component